MRLVVVMLIFCMLFTGCGTAAVWERVEDVSAETAGVWQQEAYVLQIGLPPTLSLTESKLGSSLYETADGSWQVQTQTFLAADLDTAVRYLSGYEADRLTILQISRFELPEYRFAWYSQTEEGGRLCRGDLVMDGTVCYAVISSTLETAGDTYTEQIQQVFSSFGLSHGEVV